MEERRVAAEMRGVGVDLRLIGILEAAELAVYPSRTSCPMRLESRWSQSWGTEMPVVAFS